MNVTIDSTDIQKLLLKKGYLISNISLADEYYVLPTDESIVNFGKRYYDFLWKNNLNTWIEEIWDCDDFALLAKTLASIDNAIWKKETKNADCSLAFGIAWISTPQGGHAVNIAIQKDSDGILQLNYFEPQIGTNNQGTLGQPFVCLQKMSLDSSSYPLWCYL